MGHSLDDYSTVPASNNAGSPGGFKEGWEPSQVNDCMREFAAAVVGSERFVASSGTDTYTATSIPSPSTATYPTGALYFVQIGNPNTSTTPSLNLDSRGAKTIVRPDNSAVLPGDANGNHLFQFDGTSLRLLNPIRPLAKSGTIASASTVSIGATAANYVIISGTTTITAFDSVQSGVVKDVEFSGALTLTHSSVSLILPGGTSITTAAGDTARFASEGSGNWRCLSYSPAVQVPAITKNGGSIAQIVNTETGAVATGTTIIPNDDTIPQNTEGDQYMSLSITPNNSNSKLKIDIVWIGANNGAGNIIIVGLFQDSTANALAAAAQRQASTDGSDLQTISFSYFMTAGTTSSITFKVRAGAGTASTTTFNGAVGSRLFGGVLASSITITEILP